MKSIASLIHPQHIRLILVMLTLWFSEPAQSQKKLFTATKSFSSAWSLEWNVDTPKRYILKVSGV